MKKLLALLLALTMALSLAACGGNEQTNEPSDQDGTNETQESGGDEAPDIKVGFIFLHDENSTYDLNFINGAKAACEALGITDYVLKTKMTAATLSSPTASATRTT